MSGDQNQPSEVALFKSKEIRRTIHNKEWWFSVVDVVEALTESADAKDYWFRMKERVKSDDGIQLSTICRQPKAVRNELTDEWDKRGVKEQKEYEILTVEISKASFVVTPAEYKKLKGLKRENLRDHTCLPAGRWMISN